MAESPGGGYRTRPGRGDRSVVIVDDGVATGATARAAARVLSSAPTPKALSLFAVPVGPQETVDALEVDFDVVVALVRAVRFDAVGSWFDDFGQIPDVTVTALLQTA